MQFKLNTTGIKRAQKAVASIKYQLERATAAALNDSAKHVQVRASRSIATTTGYSVSSIKKRTKIFRASLNQTINNPFASANAKLEAVVFFDSTKPLNVARIKGTRALKSGSISFNYLGKRYKRRGFFIKVKGVKLAVRHVLTGKENPKYRRAKRGKVKTSVSGNRYISGYVQSIPGPSVPKVFRDRVFQAEVDAALIEFYPSRFRYHYDRFKK